MLGDCHRRGRVRARSVRTWFALERVFDRPLKARSRLERGRAFVFFIDDDDVRLHGDGIQGRNPPLCAAWRGHADAEQAGLRGGRLLGAL